jgi:hypothetical protein
MAVFATVVPDTSMQPGFEVVSYTHPRPMTAYTYTMLFLSSCGLGERAVSRHSDKAGTELAAYRAEHNADFMEGVDTTISDPGVPRRSEVVYSWPETLGDRTFSGLMVRRTTLSNRREQISAALRAYQRALDDIGRLIRK